MLLFGCGLYRLMGNILGKRYFDHVINMIKDTDENVIITSYMSDDVDDGKSIRFTVEWKIPSSNLLGK